MGKDRTTEQIQANIDDIRTNMPWSEDRDEALETLYRELAEAKRSPTPGDP